ncbi:PREDICTED: TBC1 domain family member 1 isoform X2 [Nicrophorus vespilloides]|uniref:TBC1 domain family member 1 isoform X2 n=1 Tax=Nicrophorus vespilloides TaxID=110193 RepID=A0ABM1MS44_NICVS|nr:PREDICTED: TBC1 domain family member 1 isoform X2 [Nicrophorus vespilloides]
MISVPMNNPYVGSHSDASYFRRNSVSELYERMKEHSLPSVSNHQRSISNQNLTSLCVDISPSSSNFFEVLYIGKIKVWHKKVPDTFIDDALQKFKQHDQERSKRKLNRLKSEMDLRRGSIESTGSTSSTDGCSIGSSQMPKLQRSLSLLSNLSIKSPDIDRKVPVCIERITEGCDDGETEPQTPNEPTPKIDLKSDYFDDHNRTMVLQVDRTDLRLISPDRKVILLHKQHRDVATCIQGISNSEYFGFICREGNSINTYIGFVFKCESSSVASEAVAAITQAFNNNVETKSQVKPTVTSCDHCPMVWYHKLCCDIENLSARKTQAAIFRKIEQMDDEEQSIIMTKYQGAETDSIPEQNEFLMMLLRAHCEMRQGRHVHDTAENRSEFLNQYLGGSTIFMKAKRSLSNSFDHLMKRRASKDDFSIPSSKELSLNECSPNADASDSEGFRSRSSTVSSMDLKDHCIKESASPERGAGLKSPMMDIFYKVGSSPKSPVLESSPRVDAGSWRQAIFKRVITPSKPRVDGRKLSREELRDLWRKSIHQAILLVRMEKENASIRAKQEESAVKRIKLEYDEMRDNPSQFIEVWDLITKDAKIVCDNQILLNAIKQGVPRGKRGDVWHVLAIQYCTKVPPIDLNKYPNYNVPYETLLKQLTSHQHAILIDLGRTFPTHSYYSSPLGPGQLALFNLLKAYSLLDPEVGYCQGLSFVAGVLLLHMEESHAFFLLRHLMYRRDLRKQYLPDMVGLQVKLYQLSRLLHDQLPEIYAHLDMHEVAPTLYAAPWLLTIFASQFPLGFVTRVFDLIFLENADVIFRVILALFRLHKEQILACDTFEDIMNYFKLKLPAIDKLILCRIMKEVCTSDISKQLNEYYVEYYVLQEEIQSVQPQVEAFNKLEAQNKHLAEQNKNLMGQLELAMANVQRLDKNRAVQQSCMSKLEMQTRTLEVTVATLGNFINNLIEDKVDIEIPSDVGRIVSQLTFTERRKSNSNIFSMFKKNDNNPNKFMVKSLSTGKISLNNNNNTNNNNKNNFFSNSHKDILDQKMHSKVEMKISNEELLNALNRNGDRSPDSGVATPQAHSPSIDTANNNSHQDSHPLSAACDINFTYNKRELRKVKSVRDMSRNSSPVK